MLTKSKFAMIFIFLILSVVTQADSQVQPVDVASMRLCYYNKNYLLLSFPLPSGIKYFEAVYEDGSIRGNTAVFYWENQSLWGDLDFDNSYYPARFPVSVRMRYVDYAGNKSELSAPLYIALETANYRSGPKGCVAMKNRN